MKQFLNEVLLNLNDLRRLGRNIKGVWKETKANVYEFVAVTLLTLKVARKYARLRVPFRQILMLDSALKVTRELEKNGIEYCLIGGSLLGAVRQKAFAGRPSDFDIAIKEQDWQRILSLQSEFLKLGLKTKNCFRRDKTSYGGIVHIWPKILRPKTRWGMIDVHVHAQVGNFWRFKDSAASDVPKFQVLIDFPVLKRDSFGEIFGYQFPIPTNYEEYLIQSYGQRWRTPESKQFSWRNPEITRR